MFSRFPKLELNTPRSFVIFEYFVIGRCCPFVRSPNYPKMFAKLFIRDIYPIDTVRDIRSRFVDCIKKSRDSRFRAPQSKAV